MSLAVAEATAYEQVTRQQVEEVGRDLDEYKRRVNGNLEKIDARLMAIEKQLNARPSWAVSITMTALSSLTVGLITYLATMAPR